MPVQKRRKLDAIMEQTGSTASWPDRHGKLYFILLCFTLGFPLAGCYKPVILIHGVNSDGGSLSDLAGYIKAAHPGTIVTSLGLYNNIASFIPLHQQLPDFVKKLRPLMEQAQDGVHLICHSQGGLICRAIVETMVDHNIDTLITLSSPLIGQFGIPPYWTKYFPFFQNKTDDEISKLVYSQFFQKLISVANYWRDPRPQYFKEFEEYCTFLALLDNNPFAANYDSKVAVMQKSNFLKLRRLVALGGPDDGVINPWQSSLFAYVGDDATSVVPMEKQELYESDWFGLRTLDERGSLVRYAVPDVKHKDWHRNATIFERYIKKWLD